MNNTIFTPTADVLAIGTYYIATNYGLEKETAENTANIDNIANSNTEKLQKLVDQVSANGGGTIFFPVGTYYFGIKEEDLPNLPNAVHPYALSMPSNVSIVGENTETTIFKLIDINEEVTLKVNDEETAVTQHYPYTLFYFMGDKDHPITGCSYTNFTVDAFATDKKWVKEPKESEESDNYVKGNMYYAKAFYYQYVKNCVFRDLILKGTLGTALGIDYLDNVQIENVNCYQCGRNFFDNNEATGSSGIGIGTGGWENENFYIHNCTCVESGQYGIFIENQTRFGWGGGVTLYSKGCIISNCITRNGKHRGLGIRGGQYVTVIGCESYENAADGIYVDGYCKNVKISNCNFAANEGNGIYLNKHNNESEENLGYKFEKIVFLGNIIEANKAEGIHINAPVTDLIIMNNHVKGNTKALLVSANAYIDCIVKDNIFFGTIENHGSYAGNLQHNELLKDCDFCLSIPYSDFTQGFKINPDGTIQSQNSGMITDYIDISNLSSSTFILGISSKVNLIRVAQYDIQKESLSKDFGKIEPCSNDSFTSTHIITKRDDARYIRIFIEYSGKPLTEDFFVSIYK